jgi:hypothetical protein
LSGFSDVPHGRQERINQKRVDAAQRNPVATAPAPENCSADKRPPGNEIGKLASNHESSKM